MRVAVAVASILLSAINLAAAKEADAAVKRSTNIPAQRLESALETLAKERHFQILYRTEVVGQLQASGAVGEFTVEETLEKILSGTGLTYKYLDDNAITIVPIGAATASGAQSSHNLGESTINPTAADEPSSGIEKEAPKSLWQRFRLAQAEAADTTRTAEPGVTDDSADLKRLMLEEIIVTAQKREERLQDVPIPVTAIAAKALVQSDQVRLQDYFDRIPGFNVTPGPQAANYLVIRGITTGVGNPSVGVLIDEIPYGASTELGGGLAVPDIDPNDLARIEVLRGPQGTLYGASSIGGLIKFVTVDPQTDEFTARVHAGTSSVRNGDELGYNVRGAVNVPLGDSFAVRASGFTRVDPGYIDNPRLGKEGVNEAQAQGGRLSALWQASETVSLKLSALVQDLEGDGNADVYQRPGLGDLQQEHVLGTTAFDRKAQAFGATLNAAFGDISLTSASGYSKNAFTEVQDFEEFVPRLAAFNDNEVDRFSQEVRLTMPLGSRVELLVGGFYTDEDSRWVQDLVLLNPVTGVAATDFFFIDLDTGYQEYAGFADLTFKFTDRFDVQIGGRQGKIKQTFSQATVAGGVSGAIPEIEARSSPFTYLLTPRFKITPDVMAYARFASGYRVGGTNTGDSSIPRSYDPDETLNYEVGLKGEFLEGRLLLDTSIYYIDWKDVQVLIDPPENIFNYRANVGRAKSKGVELSMSSDLTNGLRLGGWVAWNDAVLTEDFPAAPTVGRDGDRLPFSSRIAGNVSLDKEFALSSDMFATLGAVITYIGDRREGFVGVGRTRREFPGYTKTDLRLALSKGSWSANVFVNNVADKRGVQSSRQLLGSDTVVFNYIQPRTIGLSFAKEF